MSVLEVSNLQKSFGSTDVLKNINFSLERGEILSIIGSSGSGKTTLLRCLNFLETPDEGIISCNGDVLFDSQDADGARDKEKQASFRSCVSVVQLIPAVYGAEKRDAGKGTAGKGSPRL